MNAERKPLGTLDSNVTRVQPTRAAKTEHRWLSQRQQKHNDFRNAPSANVIQNHSYLQQLARQHLRNGIENVSNENLSNHAFIHKNMVSSNIHNRTCCHILTQTKNLLPRVPLKTLPFDNSIIYSSVDNKKHQEVLSSSPAEIAQSELETLNSDSDISLRSVVDVNLSKSFSNDSYNTCKSRNTQTNSRSPNRFFHSVEILDEYLPDILSYMKYSEIKYKAKANYLEKQVEITNQMRIKLIDWLIEVQEEYKLHNETLYLGVAFVDRFLSQMSVTRSKLQLLGTASLFLAAKFEEIYPPDATEFAYVTADTYTLSEVLMMERMILNTFNCELAIPTAFQFLTIFLEKSNFGQNVRHLSYFILEITLLDVDFLKYLPSIKAAASLTLAVCTIRYAVYCDVINGNLEDSQESAQNMSVEGELPKSKLSSNSGTICSTVCDVMLDSVQEIFNCVVDMTKTHLKETESNRFVREKYLGSLQCHSARVGPILASTSIDDPFLSFDNVTAMWHS